MNWDVAMNLFETTTRRRFAVMDALVRDHADRCANHVREHPGDPELAAISSRATAACTAWEIAYLHWRSSRSTRKGRTHGVRELLTALRGRHIGLWQVMVQNTDVEHGTWLKGSPRFASLFPQGRRPFQQGSIDSRTGAVAELADRLERISELASVAVVVRAFHARLVEARNARRQAEESAGVRSGGVEAQRRAAALVLYRNMARLMEKYAETPELVLTFFDLKQVKRSPRETNRNTTGKASADAPGTVPAVSIVPPADNAVTC